MNETVENLPDYLRKYCVEQPQDKYTAEEHASWRYIMRQSREFFKEHAVPIYLKGLEETGISFDRIPRIEEMDQKLRQLGWGAVPVCGFIPPAAFLEFQARKILPIASDMRSVDHIHYTPAPDIVHEAAGHAPIVADPAYSEYLTLYGSMAQKAIFSQEDLNLYEAIRRLSDIKENPDSTPEMIATAEQELEQAANSISFVSEANKVTRMNWWTVEYGLLGPLENPKIYGAGLLSSVGESQNCLTDRVKKIPLSIDCVKTSYDITEPQPQLFVGEDIDHLCSVLRELDETLAYRRGGIYGLEQAKSGSVTTTVLDSGLEISGNLVDYEVSHDDRVDFLRFEGPVQLAHDHKELPGQGVDQHQPGFSSPIGRWQPVSDRDPAKLSDAELKELGIVRGDKATLDFVSGYRVTGTVAELHRENGRLLYIKWQDAKVTRGDQVFFRPEWGDFDMAVGSEVVSVYGGPAERETYGTHDMGHASTTPGRTSPFTDHEKAAFAKYREVRDLRDQVKRSGASSELSEKAMHLSREIEQDFSDKWLLRLECLELGYLTYGNDDAGRAVVDELRQNLLSTAENAEDEEHGWIVRQGVELAHVPD